MDEIRRIIMDYAWELAKRQAKLEGCTARECFAWALTKAWKELKDCENIVSDVHTVMEAALVYALFGVKGGAENG